MSTYVLITPAKNEEGTIEYTIKSVLSQTLAPKEWIVVSDESTDATDAIVKRYALENTFIRLIRIEGRPKRNFGSVVFATQTGINSLQSSSFDYLGLLDADVRFGPEYFESLINRFAADPELGLAGGLVQDVIDGKRRRSWQHLKDVAGATQFFRRECFASIGGLIPIPEGGWDAITCFQARANGYKTLTFTDLVVDHLKPRNVTEGNIVRRQWQNGTRDHALAGHPLFELLKCGSRCLESPFLIGAAARLAGFVWCSLTNKKRTIGPEIVSIIQNEQLSRILPPFMYNYMRKRSEKRRK